MNSGNAKKFLEECLHNDTARQMVKNAPKPETPEEQMAVYLNIAKTLGYKITPEELSQAVGERKQEVKAKNDAVVSQVQELDLEDLDDVAGGYYIFKDVCSSTFNTCEDGMDDCWFDDRCDYVLNKYRWKNWCMTNELDHAVARCTNTVKSTEWK